MSSPETSKDEDYKGLTFDQADMEHLASDLRTAIYMINQPLNRREIVQGMINRLTFSLRKINSDPKSEEKNSPLWNMKKRVEKTIEDLGKLSTI